MQSLPPAASAPPPGLGLKIADILRQQSPGEFARLHGKYQREHGMDPGDWAEQNFHIEDPCDIKPGEGYGKLLGPGLIRLFPIQKALLRAALDRTSEGFRWPTIVWSAVKKSGKSRIAAMVDCWAADQLGPYAEVYLAANDGKQSGDRLLQAIVKGMEVARKLQADTALTSWRYMKTSIKLPDGSFIEAIPVDPTGQAGGNPTVITVSEMWGYRLEDKQRLWAALTLSPTRRGHSFRWVDTYAGYEGESPILESLYEQGVNQGRYWVDWARDNHWANLGDDKKQREETIRLLDEQKIPLFVNEASRLWCYWETEPRFPWQTEAYYQEQAAALTDMEYRRVHKNEWVTSEDVFVPIEWWKGCEAGEFPPLQPGEQVVLGVDAAVSGDSFAVVGVTRHPAAPKTHVAVRYSRVWYPPKGGKLDFEPIDQEIRRFCAEHNVVEVAFDHWQMHKMATDQVKDYVAHWREFSQQGERLEADVQLYQLIRAREIVHDGTHGELTQHIANANSKMSKEEETRLRIVKSKRGKIDACVALSMAAHRCLYLNL